MTDLLADRLASRADDLAPSYRGLIEAMAEHLQGSGMTGRARRVGDRAPDFALPNDAGPMSLAAALAQGPAVVSFFRGEWCPFCRLELDALLDAAPAIAARGASLLMLAPQAPSEALRQRVGGLPRTAVAHDHLAGVALAWGIAFLVPAALEAELARYGHDLATLNGAGLPILPIPATYVVDRSGTIALAGVEPDFRRRTEPADILAAVDRLG